jgi:phosphotransacetylase
MFLAASTRDIARVLGAMAELIHADGEAEFDSAVKAERAAKRKPRRDVAGAAPC